MSTPHPLTVASVHLQGGRSATGARWRTSFQCGCSHQESTDRWWLCGYHEGFDDGVEAVLRAGEATRRPGDARRAGRGS